MSYLTLPYKEACVKLSLDHVITDTYQPYQNKLIANLAVHGKTSTADGLWSQAKH